jgi:hypothetical protein
MGFPVPMCRRQKRAHRKLALPVSQVDFPHPRTVLPKQHRRHQHRLKLLRTCQKARATTYQMSPRVPSVWENSSHKTLGLRIYVTIDSVSPAFCNGQGMPILARLIDRHLTTYSLHTINRTKLSAGQLGNHQLHSPMMQTVSYSMQDESGTSLVSAVADSYRGHVPAYVWLLRNTSQCREVIVKPKLFTSISVTLTN